MTDAKTNVIEYTFQPIAVGTTETKVIYKVKAGERVRSCSVQPLIAADAGTNSSIIIGDSADDNGYLTALDTETMVYSTIVDGGTAAYFTSTGGKLYSKDDEIRLQYTTGTTPGTINPKIRIKLTVMTAGK